MPFQPNDIVRLTQNNPDGGARFGARYDSIRLIRHMGNITWNARLTNPRLGQYTLNFRITEENFVLQAPGRGPENEAVSETYVVYVLIYKNRSGELGHYSRASEEDANSAYQSMLNYPETYQNPKRKKITLNY